MTSRVGMMNGSGLGVTPGRLVRIPGGRERCRDVQMRRCAGVQVCRTWCVGRHRLQAVETGPIQLWDCRVVWMGVWDVGLPPALFDTYLGLLF